MRRRGLARADRRGLAGGGIALELPSGIFSDYDASNVTLSGADVTSWLDEYTGFGTLTPTGAAKPTYTASNAGVNGKPTVDWAGVSGSHLDTAAAQLAQPSTYLFVVYRSGTPFTGTIMDGITSTYRNILRNSTVWQMYAGASLNNGTITAGAHKVASVFDGISSSFFVDNFTTASVSGNAGGLSGQIRLGDSPTVGASVLNGSIARVVVYPRVLTAQEIRQAGDYLNDYFGLTG